MAADSLESVGRVVKPHGLRGELVVRPSSDGSDVLLGVAKVTLERADGRHAFDVVRARLQGHAIVLTLTGIPDRTAAEAWLGANVLLRVDELPPPDPGEFYRHQLIGMPLVTPTGEPIGRVVDLESAPNQEWLVVEGPKGRALVPFAEKLLEVREDRIVADLPEGLFDL